MRMTGKSNITIQVYANDDAMSKSSGKKKKNNALSQVNQSSVSLRYLDDFLYRVPSIFCRLKSLKVTETRLQ